MPIEKRSTEQPKFNSGPYLAKIVSHVDPKFMGTLQVELLRDVGNLPGRSANIFQVKYLSPFYGVTGLEYNDNSNTYNGTQKSYGWWAIPPDPGSLVLVIFVEGDPRQGYWIGCVQDDQMNFMVPGLAATELTTEKTAKKKPVAEYNKRTFDLSKTDSTQINKPVHPLANILEAQGLLEDETRGITTSSARREIPSAVFGISTPGPLDRSPGSPTGRIGKTESKIVNAPVSRLGGTTFVMDDGDDKFLRKSHPSEGPPEYASVENDEKGGNPTIPHNELVRIRTRTGHQILLHNSEDLIYIGNARGTAWIELTSNGKIDIWSADSISIKSEQDVNISAGRNINLHAQGVDPTDPESGIVNMFAAKNIYQTAQKNWETKAGEDTKITANRNSNISAQAQHIETAGQIHMNGPAASPATNAKVPGRVPAVEPWLNHENLNPQEHTPDKTKARLFENSDPAAKGILKKIVDTFKKIGK